LWVHTTSTRFRGDNGASGVASLNGASAGGSQA
jgi:hypothetical protein